MSQLHPTANECFCPRSARRWFRGWLKRNSPEYSFIHTEIAPVIFHTKKTRYDGTIYRIKNPVNKKWVDVYKREEFIETVGDYLCLGFKTMKISREKAKLMILQSEGKIFSVKFKKRDNTIRDMTARLNVKKDIKGTGMSFDPSKHNLITVYDMQAESYKMVPILRLLSLKIDGVEYEVVK